MIQAMKSQNLLRKRGMSQTVKQQKVNTSKVILLDLKQKLLNQVFAIILMYLFQLQEILQQLPTMIQMLRLKIVPHFLHVQQIDDTFVDEANYIYIAMPMYSLIEHSDNYSDTSGSLWQFKRYEVLLIMLNCLLIIISHLNMKQLFQEKQQMLLIIRIVL